MQSPPKYNVGVNSHAPPIQQPKKHDDMFQTPHWRDLWAAILFIVHLAGTFFVSYLVLTKLSKFNLDIHYKKSIWGDESLIYGLSIGGTAFGGAAILTALALSVIYNNAESSLHFAFISNFSLTGALGLYFMVMTQLIPGIMMLVFCIIGVIFYFVFRNRIPFSALILQTVIDGLKAYSNMIWVGALSAVASALVMFVFLSLIACAAYLEREKVENARLLLVYSVFSLFWTSQVITNVMQTTYAGTYATFYFLYGTGQLVVDPVWASFMRSTTYSFGSICFGSLIVAIIQTVRFILNSVRPDDSIARAIIDCLLSIIESLVTYFNYYAYIQIAIYGKPYIQAAKDTFELIKRSGVDAIVNDDLISTCLSIFSLTIGIACGVAVFLLSMLIFGKQAEIACVSGIVSGICSMIVPFILFNILMTGATTTFVCFSEDPQALQRSKPNLYNAIIHKYSQLNL